MNDVPSCSANETLFSGSTRVPGRAGNRCHSNHRADLVDRGDSNSGASTSGASARAGAGDRPPAGAARRVRDRRGVPQQPQRPVDQTRALRQRPLNVGLTMRRTPSLVASRETCARTVFAASSSGDQLHRHARLEVVSALSRQTEPQPPGAARSLREAVEASVQECPARGEVKPIRVT